MADTIERVYKITADANDAVRELNKLNKSVGNIDSGLKKASAALKGAFAGVAVIGSINAITRAIGNSIDAMDALGKTTQKLGVSAQDFTALQHAAEMTDISSEKLSASITKLNKSIADAAGGGVSAGAEALRRLGVNVRDSTGEMRGSADVFRDVAQAMSELPDGADKAALSMQIFGKSGADLIPLLNEGEAGLAKFAAQAKQLGLIISETDTILADQFNDNLDLMRKQFDGAKNALVGGLLFALAELSGELASGKTDVEAYTLAGQKLGKTLLVVKQTLDLMASSLKQQDEFVRNVNALTSTVFLPDAADNQRERNAKIQKAWDELTNHLVSSNAEVDQSWEKLWNTVDTDASGLAKTISDTINSNVEKAANDYTSTISAKITADLAMIKPPEFVVSIVPQYDASKINVDQLNDQFNKDFSTAQLEATAQVTDDVSQSIGVMSSQMETAAQMNLALADSMKETENQSDSMSVAIGQTVAGSINSLVDQLASGEFSLKKFVATTIIEIAKLIAQIQILNALKATSFGASLGLAQGGAFSSLGMEPGIYTTPTTFPIAQAGKRYFAQGGIGVLAEAGPEAILPLRRGSDGRLGVELKSGTSSGGVTIHNYSNSEVSARRVDDDIEIIVNRVASDILRGGSKISRAMEGTYSVNRVRATQ